MTTTDKATSVDDIDSVLEAWLSDVPPPVKPHVVSIEEHVRQTVQNIIKEEMTKAFDNFQHEFEKQLNIVLRRAATDAAMAVKRSLGKN